MRLRTQAFGSIRKERARYRSKQQNMQFELCEFCHPSVFFPSKPLQSQMQYAIMRKTEKDAEHIKLVYVLPSGQRFFWQNNRTESCMGQLPRCRDQGNAYHDLPDLRPPLPDDFSVLTSAALKLMHTCIACPPHAHPSLDDGADARRFPQALKQRLSRIGFACRQFFCCRNDFARNPRISTTHLACSLRT